jgi:hypothetical protein
LSIIKLLFLQGSATVTIYPKFLPKGEEDKTKPVLIGVVCKEDHFWSSKGSVGEEITVELWKEEVILLFDINNLT